MNRSDACGGTTRSSSSSTVEQGRNFERHAEAHLTAQGLRLVTRNFRCRQGEIDLIMEDRGCLVFVEVRYRRSDGFGGALASVTPRKARRLRIAAEYFLANTPAWRARPCRFDVVALDGAPRELTCNWIQNALGQ